MGFYRLWERLSEVGHIVPTWWRGIFGCNWNDDDFATAVLRYGRDRLCCFDCAAILADVPEEQMARVSADFDGGWRGCACL